MLIKLLNVDLIRRFNGCNVNVPISYARKLISKNKAIALEEEKEEEININKIKKKDEKINKWISPEEKIFEKYSPVEIINYEYPGPNEPLFENIL